MNVGRNAVIQQMAATRSEIIADLNYRISLLTIEEFTLNDAQIK